MYEDKGWYPGWEETKELLSLLVKTDTCQPSGNEEQLVRVILGRLKGRAQYEVIPHDKYRSSLIIQIPGECAKGGLVFAGHLDTVSCKGNGKWKYPPHSAHIQGKKLYGRGAADMKGGITAMLLAAEHLLDQQVRFTNPIYFCFTADEENEGIGALALSGHPWLQTAQELVICEPTDMGIGCCEKGALWLELTVKGVSAHASSPKKGANALEYAMELVQKIKNIVEECAAPHPYLGRSTAAVTGMHGGISMNVVPDMAKAVLDIRTVPGSDSNEELFQKVKQTAEELQVKNRGVEIELNVRNDRPGLQNPRDCDIAKRMSYILKRNQKSSKCKGIPYYTDASQLVPALLIPFLILGPGREEQMHCIDEYVEIDQIREAARIYSEYAVEYWEERGEAECHSVI
ncbi:M20 family metallopeptidase [Faecalicatena sp. AGMB00832]|uniref:Probable succinyl-diaminopimelate desuccinylase n=1 Tax=Faecalicatena faecalis TaxID=2726362 RepID=A0ABS6D1X1_9FIRM|nr:M20 family metallopeptidase [Faecalicatena faecalis]MBU3875587.1 M20 family metallopeptidase [Faecalicatena faecalis]